MNSTTAPAAPETPVGPADLRPQHRPRWTPTASWARRILWANLVAQIVIVVTGGVVRLTGSGLGCSTWPQCEPGQFAPALREASAWHPYIEFGNRTLTGVLAVLALAAAWVAWRRRDRALPYRLLGLVPLVGVVVQAVIGGLTVLVDLHPALVGSHFLISMALVAASTALLVRHGESDVPAVPAVGRRTTVLARALLPVGAVVLALGVVVTGSGPHSGDEDAAYRFALDPAEISRLHSASVWLFLGVLATLAVVVHRSGSTARVRRGVHLLLAVTLAQGVLGYVQYLTGLPEALVALHMLGASLLTAALVVQQMTLRTRDPRPVPGTAGDR